MATKEQLYHAVRIIMEECTDQRLVHGCNKETCPLFKWCMESLPFDVPSYDWVDPED